VKWCYFSCAKTHVQFNVCKGIRNTVYLTEAVKLAKEKGVLREELLQHVVSPLAWEHINFLGEYKFDLRKLTSAQSLRPLNR
jgi:hypothetical protein